MGCRMTLAVVVASIISMVNIAHRGLWKEGGVPQNTVEAIQAAYEAGAQIVETDFLLTQSGEIICLHDMHALATMSSIVKDPQLITPEDRQRINLGEKMNVTRVFRIPLISDVLAVVPKDRVLQAEIKGYGKEYAKRFDDAVKAAGLFETNILVSCFDRGVLKDFHRQYPKYRTVWLGCGIEDPDYDLEKIIVEAKAAGFNVLCPGCAAARYAGFTCKQADKVREAGFEFRLFGVNSKDDLSFAAELKATGFTCDYYKAAFLWAKEIGGISL